MTDLTICPSPAYCTDCAEIIPAGSAVYPGAASGWRHAACPSPPRGGAASAPNSSGAAGDFGDRVAAEMAAARGYDLAALDKRAAQRAKRERTAGVR